MNIKRNMVIRLAAEDTAMSKNTHAHINELQFKEITSKHRVLIEQKLAKNGSLSPGNKVSTSNEELNKALKLLEKIDYALMQKNLIDICFNLGRVQEIIKREKLIKEEDMFR